MSEALLVEPNTAAASVLPPLIDGERLDQPTFHERYQAMPPSFRAELIAGVVFVSSPVNEPHSRFHSYMTWWLCHYHVGTSGTFCGDKGTVILGDDNEPQPDGLIFVTADKGGRVRLEGKYIVGPPELVVEVSDSSARTDLKAKRLEYESAGVREYIVVDLVANRVHWFELSGEFFRPLDPDADGITRSKVFPGLWLDAAALLELRPNRVLTVLQEGLAGDAHAAFVAKLAASESR